MSDSAASTQLVQGTQAKQRQYALNKLVFIILQRTISFQFSGVALQPKKV
jgi:hypothetical protein